MFWIIFTKLFKKLCNLAKFEYRQADTPSYIIVQGNMSRQPSAHYQYIRHYWPVVFTTEFTQGLYSLQIKFSLAGFAWIQL